MIRNLTAWVTFVFLLVPLVASSQEDETEPIVDELTMASPDVAEDVDQEETDFAFSFSPFGYVRMAYEWVSEDPNYNFIGTNNGFVLRNARLGLEGFHSDSGLGFAISVEGAADLRDTVNTPAGDLDVRLRDAYVERYIADGYVGGRIGQFKMPFSAEELRSTADLAFATRAVGLEGVEVGRGLEEPGIVVGRQLGLMITAEEPIFFGGFGFNYYLAIANGSGANQLLNDNSSLALYGRLELFGSDYVRAGGSIMCNERVIGSLPNLFNENEFGWSADLLFTYASPGGFGQVEVSGQVTSFETEYSTVESPERERLAYHAQLAYWTDVLEPLEFGPAYRFAYYHPQSQEDVTAAGTSLDSFQLTYHTIGLNLHHTDIPVSAFINYTLTGEEAPREVDNNRLEVLIQALF